MVVNKPDEESFRFFPMLVKRKQPVPYVHLVSPGLKHPCPYKAAC